MPQHEVDHEPTAFEHRQFNWEYEHHSRWLRSNISRPTAGEDSRQCAYKNINLLRKVILREAFEQTTLTMRTLLGTILAIGMSPVWADEPTQIDLPGFQCVGGTDSIRLPAKVSSLRSLGKLISEETVRIEEWQGYKAIEKLLRFNGLSVQVVIFTNAPERYSLGAVYLESPVWSLGPYRVGQPAAPLVKQLGAKNFSSNATWRFNGESDSLQIEARSGRVRRIIYECYTG